VGARVVGAPVGVRVGFAVGDAVGGKVGGWVGKFVGGDLLDFPDLDPLAPRVGAIVPCRLVAIAPCVGRGVGRRVGRALPALYDFSSRMVSPRASVDDAEEDARSVIIIVSSNVSNLVMVAVTLFFISAVRLFYVRGVEFDAFDSCGLTVCLV